MCRFTDACVPYFKFVSHCEHTRFIPVAKPAKVPVSKAAAKASAKQHEKHNAKPGNNVEIELSVVKREEAFTFDWMQGATLNTENCTVVVYSLVLPPDVNKDVFSKKSIPLVRPAIPDQVGLGITCRVLYGSRIANTSG